MEKVKVKIRVSCGEDGKGSSHGCLWRIGIFEGQKELMINSPRENGFLNWDKYERVEAIQVAKSIAKLIGIPFDPEAIKLQDC